MSRMVLAALMGLALGMGQHMPPSGGHPLQRARSGGAPGYTSTRKGGQMQCQGVKKPRNRKGQSR